MTTFSNISNFSLIRDSMYKKLISIDINESEIQLNRKLKKYFEKKSKKVNKTYVRSKKWAMNANYRLFDDHFWNMWTAM